MMHQVPEDAFAMEPQDQTVLRVLAGLQQGAEMPLQPRSFLIGSGDEADIVLADSTVADRHLTIEVGRDECRLVALDGPVQIGERRIEPGAEETVDPPVVVRLGTVVLGIGDATVDWADIAIPAPAERAPDPEEPEAPEDEDGEGKDGEDAESEAAETDGESVEEETGTTPAGTNTDPDAAPPSAPGSAAPPAPAEARPRRRLLLPAAAVLLLVAGGAIAAYLSSDNATEPGDLAGEALPLDTEDAVRAVLAQLGYAGLTVSDDPSVGVAIHGYLATDSEQAVMLAALAEAGLEPVDRTRTGERMIEAVETTLTNYRWPDEGFRRHLEVRYHGAGEIEIDGFLGPSVDRDALRRRVTGDVPSIRTLRFARSDLRGWREDLRDRIEAAGLSDWLTVTAVDGLLKVEGELSPGQVATWRAVGEAFVAASRGYPRIRSQVTAAVSAPTPAPAPQPVIEAPPLDPRPDVDPQPAVDAGPEPPDLKLVGTVIAGARSRWAVLADGRHLRPGDRLKSGGRVAEIRDNEMTIELGDRTYTYRIGERFPIPDEE